MTLEVYSFLWSDGAQDIKIEVLHTPLQWGVISHLEIRAIEPEQAALPITGTGYLSHFFAPDSVDFEKQSVVDFVKNWLDREAKCPAWQERLEKAGQYELF